MLQHVNTKQLQNVSSKKISYNEVSYNEMSSYYSILIIFKTCQMIVYIILTTLQLFITIIRVIHLINACITHSIYNVKKEKRTYTKYYHSLNDNT